MSRHPVVAGLASGRGGIRGHEVRGPSVLVIAFKPASAWPMVATSLAVHAGFFDLPLSLVDRRFQANPASVGAQSPPRPSPITTLRHLGNGAVRSGREL